MRVVPEMRVVLAVLAMCTVPARCTMCAMCTMPAVTAVPAMRTVPEMPTMRTVLAVPVMCFELTAFVVLCGYFLLVAPHYVSVQIANYWNKPGQWRYQHARVRLFTPN